MDTINKNFFDQYQSETRVLMHRGLLAILWLGIILIPFFSILDYLTIPGLTKLFLVYRVSSALLLLVLLFFAHRPDAGRHPYLLAVIGFLIACTTISILCVNLGGFGSAYYVGMLMVMITFCTILPLSVSQAASAGLMLLFIYCVPIFVFNTPSTDGLEMFFNDMFFAICFIAIAIVKCYVETRARRREFNMRMERDLLAQELADHARNLESEVAKRVRALEESKLRYQDLYDNITDMVILVNTGRNIQMANPSFYECMGIPRTESVTIPFMSIVHPDNARLIEGELLVRLLKENDINDVQFRVVNREGVTMDVECNAHLIRKDGNIIGCQMVLRDITARKQLERDLLESYRHAQNARAAAIIGLAKLAEYRDKETGAHLERIREYARIIAQELSTRPEYRDHITWEYIEDIYNSAILHDIGKVGVPDAILLKEGSLNQDESEHIKRHPVLGGDALKAVESQIEGQSFLTLGKEIAYCHHEKWDGSGYPKGMKGEEIPLSARIVTLADVYDALTSERTYKEAFSHEEAKSIIMADRGKQFAPDVVDAFVAHEKEFRRIREELFNDESPAGKMESGKKTH